MTPNVSRSTFTDAINPEFFQHVRRDALLTLLREDALLYGAAVLVMTRLGIPLPELLPEDLDGVHVNLEGFQTPAPPAPPAPPAREAIDRRPVAGVLLRRGAYWRLGHSHKAYEGGLLHRNCFLTPAAARAEAVILWGPGEWENIGEYWPDAGKIDGVVAIYRLTSTEGER